MHHPNAFFICMSPYRIPIWQSSGLRIAPIIFPHQFRYSFPIKSPTIFPSHDNLHDIFPPSSPRKLKPMPPPGKYCSSFRKLHSIFAIWKKNTSQSFWETTFRLGFLVTDGHFPLPFCLQGKTSKIRRRLRVIQVPRPRALPRKRKTELL